MKDNTSKNKVWQIIGVSVLCAVLVLGAVLGVVFGMNHSSEDLNVSKDMSNRFDNSVVIESDSEQGISLLLGTASTSSDGSSSQTLTATIEPDDASNKLVDWSVSFKNPSSTWASGKKASDYVSVAPSSDGSLTATLTCKQAFAEQIIIKCSSRELSDIFATATVDYRKKVTGVTVKMKSGTNSISTLDFCNSNEMISFEFVPQYSIYTIDDTFTENAQFKVADSFYAAQISLPESITKTKTYYQQIYSFRMSNESLLNFCYDLSSTIPTMVAKYKNWFKKKCVSGMEFLNLKITYSSSYSTAVFEKAINVGAVDFTTSVTNLTLSGSGFVF